MCKIKVGKYRLISKGTKFWSISLQEMIALDNDIPVKITNTVHGNDDYFYGILQLELFNFMIPSLVDKTNGDVGILFSKTVKYIKKTGFISELNNY